MNLGLFLVSLGLFAEGWILFGDGEAYIWKLERDQKRKQDLDAYLFEYHYRLGRAGIVLGGIMIAFGTIGGLAEFVAMLP